MHPQLPVAAHPQSPARQRDVPAGANRTAIALPSRPFVASGARAIVRNLLANCPKAHEAEQVTAELIANAVRYSTAPTRRLRLTLDLWADRLRVEVTEPGRAEPPATAIRPRPLSDYVDHGDTSATAYALGLRIVRELSSSRGLDRYRDHAVWWAELTWTEDEAAHG